MMHAANARVDFYFGGLDSAASQYGEATSIREIIDTSTAVVGSGSDHVKALDWKGEGWADDEMRAVAYGHVGPECMTYQ